MHVPLKDYVQLLATYLGPRRAQVGWLVILLFGGIGLQLANPQVIRYFLDTAQTGEATQGLAIAAVVFVVVALIGQALKLAATYVAEDLGWTTTNALRADLTLHCLRLDMPFHKTHTPGELIERVDGDVTALANFFSQFTIRVVANALLVVGILILLLREDARVGMGLALYVALTLVVLGALQRQAVSRWTDGRQAMADMFGFIEERMSGAEDIRACGAEPYVMRRLYHLIRAWLDKRRAAIVLRALVSNVTNLLYVVGYAIGLALGVHLYTRQSATIGTAYLIVFYIGMLNAPVQNLRREVQDLQQAAASILRIRELFNLRPQVQEHTAVLRPLPAKPLSVRLEHVHFAYADESALTEEHAPPTAGNGHDMVLSDISFDLPAGKVLGVLGRTGSGKTTLTRLLFRLYDPASGAIKLDDMDLRDVPLADLRERIGMVTQDVQLFQASVRDNLTFFDTRIGDDQIARVLQDLQLREWLQSLPAGLDTPLAGGGQGLSAGEAQLLAFGRIFLKDPGLVILDEASSRLDPATEAMLERAIDRLFDASRRTGIIIAHRLRTVQRADTILILEGGRVVEYGAREALARDPNSRFHGLLQTGLEEVLA